MKERSWRPSGRSARSEPERTDHTLSRSATQPRMPSEKSEAKSTPLSGGLNFGVGGSRMSRVGAKDAAMLIAARAAIGASFKDCFGIPPTSLPAFAREVNGRSGARTVPDVFGRLPRGL